MSAVAPPIAASSQKGSGATLDKEELAKFWRTGLEYIAQGVIAYQTASRYARASEIQSIRKKTTPATTAAALAAAAQVAPHKEMFESCVHALADLSPAGLFQPALAKRPSLDGRVSALEDQMWGLIDTIQTLETQLGTLGEKLSQVEPIAKSSEENAASAVARVGEVHQTLEGRINSLSSQLAVNPLPGAVASLGKEHEKLLARINSLEADVKVFADKSTQLEKRAATLESARSTIDEHSTNLVKMEGKVSEIRKNATEVNSKMYSLLALAPQAQALLTVPAQTKRAVEGVENLKKEYEMTKAEFDSMKATLGAFERKLAGSTNQGLTSVSPLTADVVALQPLKQHVNALLAIPNAVSQLQENVSEFIPLRTHINALVSVGAQTSELLGLLSHKERVDDDIAQLRGRASRFTKDLADAKKETLESVHLLNEQATTLSSANQAVQDDLVQTKIQVTQLQASAADALTRISGVDAKVKAGNFTAEWLKKQLEAMRESVADLEPLGARIEALLLLSGQTESLMPLASQFRSLSTEVRRLWEESEATDFAVDRLQKLSSDLSTASEDAKQRLGQVEANVNQLESDASHALERLADLNTASSAAILQSRQNQQSIQKAQSQLGVLAPLNDHAESLASLSQQCASLVPLAQDFQKLKKEYDTDITALKDQARTIGTISSELAALCPLTDQVADAKKQIESLTAQQQQLENSLASVEKIERRVAKVESESKQLHAKVPSSNGQAVQSTSAEAAAFKAQLAEVVDIANSTKKLAEELQPARAQLAALQTLSSQAEELISVGQKVKDIEREAKQTTQLCKQNNQRVNDFRDSLDLLDERVAGYINKTDSYQVRLDSLEQEHKEAKDANEAKLKEFEITVNKLAPLKERYETLTTLITVAAGSGERVPELEKRVGSLDKEMKNVASTLTRMDPIVHSCKAQANLCKTQENRLKELSESVEKTVTTLSPLTERTPALLALLEQPAGQDPRLRSLTAQSPREETNTTKRCDALEASIQDLRSFEVKAKEELQSLLAQVETATQVADEILLPFVEQAKPLLSLAPLANRCDALEASVQDLRSSEVKAKEELQSLLTRVETVTQVTDGVLKPFVEQAKPLLSLAPLANRCDALEASVQDLRSSEVKTKEELQSLLTRIETVTQDTDGVLKPFVDQAKPLLSLAPLAGHVESLPPLIDQVAQLQASTKSLSDRLAAAAAPEPSPASQLRSPVTDRHVSRPTSPSSNHDVAPLFPPATEGSAEPRPLKRKRHLEAMIESLEDRLEGVSAEVDGVRDEMDGMRGEVDGFANDVRQLTEESARAKRARTSEGQVRVEQPPKSELASQAREKIKEDLDSVMGVLAQLWKGEEGWKERLDYLLGQQWAEVLEIAGGDPKGAGSTIANVLKTLRSEVDVLKLAIEAHGSGVSRSSTPIVDASHIAGIEKLAEQLTDNMRKEQSVFQERLEERLTGMLRPVRTMYRALREGGEGLE